MRMRLLASSSVVPLLFAGCSGGGEPSTDSTPTGPPPTTSSVSSSGPEVAATQESPQDFIRRWVKAGDRMQVTGDTAAYRSMSPTCKPCRGFVEDVTAVYAAGGRAEFAGTTITQIKRHAARPPTFDVRQRIPTTVIRRSPDSPPQTLPTGETEIRVILSRDSQTWTVTYFGILS